MKITSINGELTSDRLNVAFNIDKEPSDEVKRKVSYGNLALTFEDGILHVRVPKSGSGVIDANVIKTINEKFAEAQAKVDSDRAYAAKQKTSVLQDLATLTGLKVE